MSIGVVVNAPTRVLKYPSLVFPPQHFTVLFSSSEQLSGSNWYQVLQSYIDNLDLLQATADRGGMETRSGNGKENK